LANKSRHRDQLIMELTEMIRGRRMYSPQETETSYISFEEEKKVLYQDK
jgi:hypothetical protein